jgi:uncharacterized protein (DUF608 family)
LLCEVGGQKVKWPFDGDAKKDRLTRFTASGFSEPVAGIIYSGSRLESGLPFGALGTGYVALEGTGKLGFSSIYNDLAPPQRLQKEWLTFKIGQTAMPLSVADIAFWGHYPVADVTARFTEKKITAGIRAFTPFIVGDSSESNTPVVLFEIEIHNQEAQPMDVQLLIEFPAPEKHGVEADLAGENLKRSTGEGALRGVLNLPVPSGSSSRARFAFGWFAPGWRDSGGEAHFHRYGQRFRGANDVAQYGLDRFETLLKKVLAWQQVIYASPLPDWLQDWLVQSFYSFAKNSVWIARTRKDEWWGEDGWFTHSESHTGCPITETMVCRMHGHFPLLFFFPELELTTLNAFKHFQISDGEIPFCFGTPTSMRDPRYHCQHPLNSGQYAQMVYRHYLFTQDGETLSSLYESAKKAIRYQFSLDDDGDGLVNDQAHTGPGEYWPANQFYDAWPWRGTSAYVAGTWLATLSAGSAMAKAMEDPSFEEECTEWLAQGAKAYEKKLWNGSYFRLWNDSADSKVSEVCLANQLMAVWCTQIMGLPMPLPPERVESALREVQRLNMGATEYGLVNGVTPEGKRFNSGFSESGDHSEHIFVGENLCAAMTFIYMDRDDIGLEVARRLYNALFLKARAPWNQRCLISSETGLPAWGDDYYSDLVIWAMPMALAKEDIAQFSKPGKLARTMIESTSTS